MIQLNAMVFITIINSVNGNSWHVRYFIHDNVQQFYVCTRLKRSIIVRLEKCCLVLLATLSL